MLNYHNKQFKLVSNSSNGAISNRMVFHYFQEENIVTCSYSDEQVVKGQLIGIVNKEGVIDMRYHQIHNDGSIMTGKCTSVPELMENGKIRLHETWQWTSGDMSSGSSVLEEI